VILELVFALIIRAPQQDSHSTESQATMKKQAHDEYETTQAICHPHQWTCPAN
jgi:hypothetical protein